MAMRHTKRVEEYVHVPRLAESCSQRVMQWIRDAEIQVAAVRHIDMYIAGRRLVVAQRSQRGGARI
jgi:hypothetical protein